MTTLETLVLRDQLGSSLSPTTSNLLIALISLCIAAALAGTAWWVLRTIRRRRAAALTQSLPTHSKEASLSRDSLAPPSSPPPPSSRRQNGRRGHGHRRSASVIIVPSPHDLVPTPAGCQMKDASAQTLTVQYSGPLPQIHITFPDEDRDMNEKRHSGRVVVVRVSENGCLGLAPYVEGTGGDEKEFMSLELERLGGLKEKGERVW